jgi:hypothetical protein
VANSQIYRSKNSPDLENRKIACPSKCRKDIDKLKQYISLHKNIALFDCHSEMAQISG